MKKQKAAILHFIQSNFSKFLILVLFVPIFFSIIACCGKTKSTPFNPGTGAIAELPSDWDGTTDYQNGDWKVESP